MSSTWKYIIFKDDPVNQFNSWDTNGYGNSNNGYSGSNNGYGGSNNGYGGSNNGYGGSQWQLATRPPV